MVESSSFKDKFLSFLTDTSLHGARFIGNKNNHWARRLIWLLLLMTAASYFLKIFIDSVGDFLSYKSVTSEHTFSASDGLPFPSVTFCPKNNIKNSSLNEHHPDIAEALRLGWPSLIAENTQDLLQYIQLFSHVKFYQLYNDTAPTIRETFIQCKIGNAVVNCEDYIEAIYWRLGICYMFNPYSHRQRHGEILIKQPGFGKGVQFLLNGDPDEYFLPLGMAEGFDIVIHDQAVFPLIEQYLWTVGPGTSVNVAMRQERHSVLPKPYSKTDCLNADSRTIEGYPYSEEACMQQCHSDHAFGQCCDFEEHDPTAEDSCWFSDILQCYHLTIEDFSEGRVKCDCPPSCVKTDYILDISTSKFPNRRGPELIQYYNWSIRSAEEMEKKWVELRFYFKTLKVNHIEQVAMSTPWELFSACGGMLGLFLGASILTLFEFIELCLIHIINKIIRKQQTNVVSIKISEQCTDANSFPIVGKGAGAK